MTADSLLRASTFLDAVAGHVERFAESDLAGSGPVVEAARYAVSAGGKRLRPALVLGAGMAIAGERDLDSFINRQSSIVNHQSPSDALAVATAFEYIHTYSLIHDDLPVMDNDALRRGRPSCHVAFDVPTAVQAGLLLIVKAFSAVERTNLPRKNEIIAALTEAAGISGMVGGQALDILAEKRPADVTELEQIHRGKTAALIRGSMIAGALAAEASSRDMEIVRRIGSAAGLAFQVVDDLLDVVSTSEVMGKPVGVDSGKGKRTYPAVLGLDASRARAEELTAEALSSLQELGKGDTILRDLVIFVLKRVS